MKCYWHGIVVDLVEQTIERQQLASHPERLERGIGRMLVVSDHEFQRTEIQTLEFLVEEFHSRQSFHFHCRQSLLRREHFFDGQSVHDVLLRSFRWRWLGSWFDRVYHQMLRFQLQRLILVSRCRYMFGKRKARNVCDHTQHWRRGKGGDIDRVLW
jgi:hypothetical protein